MATSKSEQDLENALDEIKTDVERIIPFYTALVVDAFGNLIVTATGDQVVARVRR